MAECQNNDTSQSGGDIGLSKGSRHPRTRAFKRRVGSQSPTAMLGGGGVALAYQQIIFALDNMAKVATVKTTLNKCK